MVDETNIVAVENEASANRDAIYPLIDVIVKQEFPGNEASQEVARCGMIALVDNDAFCAVIVEKARLTAVYQGMLAKQPK